MKNSKRFLILLILFIVYILFSLFSYSNAVSSDIQNNVFRLHVLANSNSKEDQDLKYKVRDSLIEYMNFISKDISSKEDAINIAIENKNELDTSCLFNFHELSFLRSAAQ